VAIPACSASAAASSRLARNAGDTAAHSPAAAGRRHRGMHVGHHRFAHLADGVVRIGGVGHGLPGAAGGADGQQGLGAPVARGIAGKGEAQAVQRRLVGKVQPARARPRRAEQGGRQRDTGVRRAQGSGGARRSVAGGQRAHRLHRVFDQRLEGDVLVGNAVHERGVGAVLQQRRTR
jgi:hypothetical protein